MCLAWSTKWPLKGQGLIGAWEACSSSVEFPVPTPIRSFGKWLHTLPQPVNAYAHDQALKLLSINLVQAVVASHAFSVVPEPITFVNV